MLLSCLKPVHLVLSFKGLGILVCYKLLFFIHRYRYSVGRYYNIIYTIIKYVYNYVSWLEFFD